jgi:hypothetical protein
VNRNVMTSFDLPTEPIDLAAILAAERDGLAS